MRSMADLHQREEDPPKDQVWTEIEETVWLSTKAKREREDREFEEAHEKRMRVEHEKQFNLWAERAEIVEKLERIDRDIRSTQNAIQFDLNGHREAVEARRKQREAEDARTLEVVKSARPPPVVGKDTKNGTGVERQRVGWPVKNGGTPTPTAQTPIQTQYGPPAQSYGYLHQQHQQQQQQQQPPPQVYSVDVAPPLFVHRGGGQDAAFRRRAEMALAAVANGASPTVSREASINGGQRSPLLPRVPVLSSNAPPQFGPQTQGNGAAASGPPQNRERTTEPTTNGTSVAATPVPATAGSAEPEPRQRTETAQNTPTRDVDMPDAPSDLTGVRIVDSEGNLIGPVRKLGRSNTWVDHAYELELKRDVAIRPGRKFGPEEFDKMYDRNDNKATKYLSVFIQAAGKVHATPCVQCTKTGVFADCIRVTTSGWFPRCGNCEWNRQACNGFSLLPKPPPAAPRPRRHSVVSGEGTQAAASAPVPPLSPVQTRSSSRAVSLTVEGPLPSGGFTAVNGSAAAKKTPPVLAADEAQPTHEEANGQGSATRKRERKSLPGGRTQLPDTTPGEEVTPAKKPRGGSRKSLPDAPVPADKGETGDDAEDEEEGDTEEITKDSLVLADDGTVFTEPEIMRGVPLEKISPSHPYWDPAWPPLEDFITPTLMKWQEKYEKATVEMATQSSKYLANRQINRGNAVLKYLREGPIHPLQIIAKRFVTKKLFNYDTIHRLVQILDELLKFKIDVTPAQWVRHRLHQKFLEKGEDFSLDEEVDALYHDSKVRYIRKKSGFGNIGRPSGYKMKGDLTAPSSQKRKSRPAKRKAEGSPSPEQPEQFAVTGDAEPEPEQQSAPPTTAPPTNAPPPAEPIPERRTSSRPTSSRGRLLTRPDSYDPSRQDSTASSSRRASKKHKADHHPNHQPSTTLQAPPPTTISSYPANDLDYSGYTSADSFSRDPIYQHDWRVYQVKTGQMTSNPTVTQYYHWVERGGDGTEELTFEHQVLKDVAGKNVTWGVYKDPFDFHLRLSELVEVRWAADSQKMVAVTKKVEGVEWRGNVIVCFKRERTKRRFVSFMGRRGVKLVKGDGAEIERMWEEMQSQVLDGNDSE